MKRCSHSAWLSLHASGESVSLHESDRLQTVIADVVDPDVQRPGLIAFLGNTTKAIALRHLFGLKAKQAGSSRALGELHLHIDPSTVDTDRPLLLADGDFSQRQPRTPGSPFEKCHATTVHSLIHRRGPNVDHLATDLCGTLLYAFTDVFCFFAADLGGFRQIARRMASWLESDCLQSLPSRTRPKVIIVSDVGSSTPEYEKNAKTTFLWFLGQETEKDVSMYLSSIEVVAPVAEGKASPASRYRRLKERLLDGCDQVRACRSDTSTLFSTTHFAALLHLACEHFCQGPTTAFDFIAASRKQNPVPNRLDEHISTFLSHSHPEDFDTFAAPTIGSSLFLDSYPPGCHSKSIPDHGVHLIVDLVRF